ncbi:MAG: hypothetical protein GX796_03355 [Clostridiaceae bacterium]|nr:hypothetical protein [Clostridiaceae bacterium]
MDMFIEKIVRKRKSIVDMLYILLIIVAVIILGYLLAIFVPQFSTILIVGLLYLAYILISKLNVEYEYALTNGDLDIDMIIDQKKRKRLLRANSKEFDVVAKVDSLKHTKEIRECKNKKDYTSRRKGADVWFISLRKDGQYTVIFFEPTEKMIDSIATYIPRKVFKD